ncbi:unnamed protein product [Taenia asiatica]|uniref:Oxysterol-binding protein n=1 Tax=Taenia asiatica TaxID=60517 RepID=A0A0R3WB40_TAEAS|nr:unnamed protein product [Taenia asiatica]
MLFPLASSGDFDVSDEYTYSMIWDANSISQSSDSSPLLIKTTNNETYACHLPTTTKGQRTEKVQDAAPHPNDLLADFFKTYPCIFKVEGFWTYELCHDKHIRQFRAEGAGPKLTRIVKEFYLGLISDSKKPFDDDRANGDLEPKSIQINGRDFSYYSVDYDDGTECDLTGIPRRASVLYVCLEESDGELFQISELETCVYQLIVFTRHLCASPQYNLVFFNFQSHKVYSNPISCVPHDEYTSRKPRALVSLEKEKEELTALGENEHLEGIFGALRVKGLKAIGVVEKLNNRGNVIYRVRTLDPLETDQETELANEKVKQADTQEVVERVETQPQSKSGLAVVNKKVLNELRLDQQRELQSFLDGETCLTGGAGWWRHEVCYGGRITQYHEDPETGERTEIVLGKWDKAAHLHWVGQSSLRKPQVPVDKRFKLTQFYDNGDFCEEIKAPRSVRLSFVSLDSNSTVGDDSDDWDDGEDENDIAWSSPRLMPEDGARLVEHALSNFENRINDLQHYQDTLKRKADDLQRSINELDACNLPPDEIEKICNIMDKATVYKVASLAMVNSCSDFLVFARTQTKRWRRIFNVQVDRRARLEQMVEELAKQIRKLEIQARNKSIHSGSWAIPGQAVLVHRTSTETTRTRSTTLGTCSGGGSGPPPCASTAVSGIISDDEDDFYDAQDVEGCEFDVILPTTSTSAATEKSSMTDAALPNSSTSSIPVGTDLAMEYESDTADSDLGGDADETEKGQRKFRGKQAHVIQKHAWGRAGRASAQPESLSGVAPGKSGAETGTSLPPDRRIIPVRKPVQRRTTIPPKPNISLNLWSILSNCIGKELTKIPMPVNFSEPLSMLQRLSENFEYSYVLDRAAACADPVEQLAYVSAFVVSSYASTALRVNKPFNPLLNETYECDRTDDLGWRSVAEQISHHPPVAAFHCESDLWYTWFDFSISTKFRGRYLQIKVNGVCHLVFRKTGYHYTWTKIPLTVHNIIVGKLWIENSGEIDITNHKTGDKCHLTFKPYSYFSSDIPRRVTGAVSDKLGKVHGIINGTWDEFIEYAPVVTNTLSTGGEKPVLETGPPVQLWRVSPLPPEADKMYNFTQFAIQLNDKPDNEPNLCPTDSRLRPDQRLMEEGLWDEANIEKVRLEEKQRLRRRQMALALINKDSSSDGASTAGTSTSSVNVPASLMDTLDEAHRPLWFEKEVDPDTGLETMKFTGRYWEFKEKNDWSMCPDLY